MTHCVEALLELPIELNEMTNCLSNCMEGQQTKCIARCENNTLRHCWLANISQQKSLNLRNHELPCRPHSAVYNHKLLPNRPVHLSLFSLTSFFSLSLGMILLRPTTTWWYLQEHSIINTHIGDTKHKNPYCLLTAILITHCMHSKSKIKCVYRRPGLEIGDRSTMSRQATISQ